MFPFSSSKCFASDNEGSSQIYGINKIDSHLIQNETQNKNVSIFKQKQIKPKIPKNFGKKKFKYTIDEESDTNMIIEQEYESSAKSETRTINNINLKLLTPSALNWKKNLMYLLNVKENKGQNDGGGEKIVGEKFVKYLMSLIQDNDRIKNIIVNDEEELLITVCDNTEEILQKYKFKLKLLIIYIRLMNDREIKESTLVRLFSNLNISIPFYIATESYLYAKLYNKKMNYIFMNEEFISEKDVKVLLFQENPSAAASKITSPKSGKEDSVTISTRGFLPKLNDTEIKIEGSTSSTFSLSSDEDYLESPAIFTKNCVGIVKFRIREKIAESK